MKSQQHQLSTALATPWITLEWCFSSGVCCGQSCPSLDIQINKPTSLLTFLSAFAITLVSANTVGRENCILNIIVELNSVDTVSSRMPTRLSQNQTWVVFTLLILSCLWCLFLQHFLQSFPIPVCVRRRAQVAWLSHGFHSEQRTRDTHQGWRGMCVLLLGRREKLDCAKATPSPDCPSKHQATYPRSPFHTMVLCPKLEPCSCRLAANQGKISTWWTLLTLLNIQFKRVSATVHASLSVLLLL